MKKGILYLIPTAVAEESQDKILTPQLAEVLQSTKHFVAEHAREARRFISSLKLGIKIENLQFVELDKHRTLKDAKVLLAPALEGNNLGLMSDAGCPGVADPGAELVSAAHAAGITVVPLVGPSSILLALMASGMSGQNFRFNGYLPIDQKELRNKLRELEQHSRQHNETQIFIETPYRSDKLLKMLSASLGGQVRLVVATDLTGPGESIMSHTIAEWQKRKLVIGKKPTVFLFLA